MSAEPTTGVAVAGAATAAALGPVTHGYAYIVAGAMLGTLLAMSEMGKMAFLRWLAVFGRSTLMSSLLSSICAAGLAHWLGEALTSEYTTPQGLLASVAVGLGWFFADWRGKLRAARPFAKRED